MNFIEQEKKADNEEWIFEQESQQQHILLI
jgi:hypothetical protein